MPKVFEMLVQFSLGIRNTLPAASLWFLPCIFIVYVYYSVLYLVFRSDIYVALVSLVIFFVAKIIPLYTSPQMIFNIDSALIFLAYYALGKLFYTYIVKGNSLISINGIAWKILTLLGFIIAAYIYFYGVGVIYSLASGKYSDALINISVTTLLFIPSIYLSRLFIFTPILYLGRNTLLLCGTEQLVKLLVVEAVGLAGIHMAPANPLQVFILTSLCFTLSYFLIIPSYNKLMSNLRW